MKRPEEARAQIERALELDPLNPLFQAILGWHFLLVGRYDDAILQLRKTLSKEPNLPAAHNGLWAAFGRKQRHEEGVAAAKDFFTLLGDREVADTLTRGYADGGYSGAMRLAAEKLAARSKVTYVSPIQIATLYAHAGEKKQALAWLEKAYEERNANMALVNVDAHWASLREEPGFQDLLRRMKLPR
jgi:tetratricopeptide (TPR) repeat protein